MEKAKLYLKCNDVLGHNFDIQLKDVNLAIEMHGNLLVYGLGLQQKDGVKMTATFPLTTLQAARIGFWMRHGDLLERPYISIA